MRTLVWLAGCALAFAGCGVLDIADLEGGSIHGTVVDKVPVVSGGEVVTGGASAGTTYYLLVEDAVGSVSRVEVTYAAFQAVDTGDILPDDLREPIADLR